MKVLAVTCYTGDRELVEMTAKCLHELEGCKPSTVDIRVVAIGQGTASAVGHCLCDVEDENKGFAHGMNRAIELGVDFYGEYDYVLCFNNDLEFPDKDWLRKLLEIAVHPPHQIIVPATDRTAMHKQPGPENRPSFPVQEASAYCWLVPWAWCEHLKRTHGWWLFDPEFFAYGEDNWTAFLLSKAFGPKIFRMVPRAFVRHLRHQTSSHVKVDRKRSNRLLVDRLQRELQDRKLRPDLQAWARRYIAILSKRQ